MNLGAVEFAWAYAALCVGTGVALAAINPGSWAERALWFAIGIGAVTLAAQWALYLKIP